MTFANLRHLCQEPAVATHRDVRRPEAVQPEQKFAQPQPHPQPQQLRQQVAPPAPVMSSQSTPDLPINAINELEGRPLNIWMRQRRPIIFFSLLSAYNLQAMRITNLPSYELTAWQVDKVSLLIGCPRTLRYWDLIGGLSPVALLGQPWFSMGYICINMINSGGNVWNCSPIFLGVPGGKY